ncbi:hypothetical protein SUDANB95_01962 [Actinosynnema sp. ALI-1.44]
MADRWLAVHLFHHDEQDRLLRRCVRPLVDDLVGRGLVRGHFFVRHWQGGPHVRLRLLCPPRTRPEIRARVTAELDRYTRSHGSTVHWGPEDYRRIAAELARVERDPAGVEPLRPDNSHEFRDHDPDHGWRGAAARAVEDGYAESSRIVLDLLAPAGSGEHRHGLALAMTVAGAVARSGHGTTPGHVVGRAADRWAARVLGERRSRFEEEFRRQYHARRDAVLRLVDQALHGGDETLDRWADTTARLRAALTRTGASAAAVDLALDSFAHLHNNRLGLTVRQEAYVLHAAGWALDDLTSTPPDAGEQP